MHEFSRYYRCSMFFGICTIPETFSWIWCPSETTPGKEIPSSQALNGNMHTWPQRTCARFCDTCLASLGKGTHPAMSGRNYSLAAAWWLTRLNHEAYVEKESGPLSPYMNIEGFKIESVVYDIMHNIFLGIGRDLFASGLKLLICKNVWEHLGEDWDTILAGIHLEMHQTCAAYGFLAQFGYIYIYI